ncbi:MAG TPA: hypothetical protein VLZ07_06430, partial [Syntrophales bacterium]|nr:hypothetical protein [Syntrophales bacterium]
MDSPTAQVTLKGNSGDQTAASGPAYVRKKGNGVNGAVGLFDLIGGALSFAKLLDEKSSRSLLENGDAKKDDSSAYLANHTSAPDEDGTALAGSVLGRLFSLTNTKGHVAAESLLSGREGSARTGYSLQKASSGQVSFAPAEEKTTPHISGKDQSPQGEPTVAETDDASSAKETGGQRGKASSIRFMQGPENGTSPKETAQNIAHSDKPHSASANSKDLAMAEAPMASVDDETKGINLKGKIVAAGIGNA